MNETRINASQTGFEMNVMVNGVYEWREAHRDIEWVGIDITANGMEPQCLVSPWEVTLREGEHLHRLIDGSCFITTMQRYALPPS